MRRATMLIAVWAAALLADPRAIAGPSKIAHYATDSRDTGFVLDESGVTPRLRFDGSQEILAGWWRPAAGGDRILVRDDGVLMLRQNVAGGMTLFTSAFPMGVPVNFDRPAMPLEGPPPPIDTVRDTAREAAAEATQAFGIGIQFEGDWDLAANDAGVRAILFDAIQNAGAALQTLAQEPQGRAAVGRHLRVIRFARGPQPGLTRQRSVAIVIYTIDYGVAARPSSYRIAQEIRLQFR